MTYDPVRFVRFELTLPLRYNPPSVGDIGTSIPREQINEVRAALRRRFKGIKTWTGEGDSFYPETGDEYIGEPEQYVRVNVSFDDAKKAFEWFRDHCPNWATTFVQKEIFLEIPDLGLTFRFPPSELPQPKYTNPFP